MRRRSLLSILPVLASLAACVPNEPFQALPLVPAGGEPIRLAVVSVETVDRRGEVTSGDFFTRRRDDRLAEAALELMRTRLQAQGLSGLARAELTTARIVEKPLETKGGLFDTAPLSELEATVAVRIAILDGAAIETASASAEVVRAKAIPRGAGAIERDQVARSLTQAALADLDAALAQSARANLGAHLLF
jgi:hypothetical protein